MKNPFCQPCEVKEEWSPVELEKSLCPIPEPPKESKPSLFTVKQQVVRQDCFQDMLKNMTANKFCSVGPKACDK